MNSIRKKMRSKGHIDVSQVDTNAPVHIDLGQCPRCRHTSPLTDFVTHNDPNAGPIVNDHENSENEATRLVHELTDKLASIVQIESQIRKLIEHYSNEATTPRGGHAPRSPSSRGGSMFPSEPAGLHSVLSVDSVGNEVVKITHKSNVSQLLELGHGIQHNRRQPSQGDSNAFDLKNLDQTGQQALALLDTHENITFKLTGAAMVSPQEKLVGDKIDARMRDFSRKFLNQHFMIGINKSKHIFTVLSKSNQKQKTTQKDSTHKQYRHIRSFQSLEGAHFESAKDNMLRIWFRNARGYFLLSFASQTEANTVMNLVNIIAHNEDYSGINPTAANGRHYSISMSTNQLIWAGYVSKKGKRMGLYSPRFLVLQGIDLLIYKSHNNYQNGEDPSHKFSLLTCDFSQRADNKEIKFRKKDNGGLSAPPTNKKDDGVFLTIRLFNEIERDDLLNLCAQTLGHAIAQGRTKMGHIVSKLDDTLGGSEDELSISTDSSQNEELKLAEASHDYETPGGMSKSSSAAESNELPRTGAMLKRQQSTIGNVVLHTMSITSGKNISSSPTEFTIAQNNAKFHQYFQQLDNTPRMYGASHIKALNRLAKRRASDIDFIEANFKGNEAKLVIDKQMEDRYVQSFKLLDILGKSMQSGAFLNETLYLHKAVWAQNKVMLDHYDLKLETFLRMQTALEGAFGNVDIAWLQKNNFSNSKEFHEKLLLCESGMKEAEQSLKDFMLSNKNKTNKKGAAKFLNKIKDTTKKKVYDNQPYRDAIQRICLMAGKLGMYYNYLPQSTMNEKTRNQLTNDLRNIVVPLTSFGQVVMVDMKIFLRAYLRRGSKNIYE